MDFPGWTNFFSKMTMWRPHLHVILLQLSLWAKFIDLEGEIIAHAFESIFSYPTSWISFPLGYTDLHCILVFKFTKTSFTFFTFYLYLLIPLQSILSYEAILSFSMKDKSKGHFILFWFHPLLLIYNKCFDIRMFLKDNYYTGIWYYLQAVQGLEPMEIEKCFFLGRRGGTNVILSISFSHPSTNEARPCLASKIR